MHHQLVLHEVEAVGTGFKRVLDHQLRRGLVHGGELVDVFAGVHAVRDAETKVKVESLVN